MASVVISGDTSGAATISAPAVAGTPTLTLPTTTDTLVGKATTDTLTNKTLTSPTLTTPALGTPASGVMTNVTGINYDGYKNRLINSAMVIDQRNAGASISAATLGTFGYIADRWFFQGSQSAKFSAQQNQGSVTPPAGFTNYLGLTVASAVSVGASDYFFLQQSIEGFNIADLGWGTANAQTVTLSFKVYSSLTGTFGGCIRGGAVAASYPFTYSIPVANTWTTISVTIAGNTGGTWASTNATGLGVAFGLGAGSSFSGTAGSWSSSNYVTATGATSVVGTSGATFYITGVQLEKGSTATSFDYRPYGTELALCQRYYQRYTYVGIDGYAGAGGSGNTLSSSFWWSVQMRAAPTVTFGALAFSQNTANTVPDIVTIAPTSSYLLTQIVPTAAGRTYLYNPVFASSEL